MLIFCVTFIRFCAIKHFYFCNFHLIWCIEFALICSNIQWLQIQLNYAHKNCFAFAMFVGLLGSISYLLSFHFTSLKCLQVSHAQWRLFEQLLLNSNAQILTKQNINFFDKSMRKQLNRFPLKTAVRCPRGDSAFTDLQRWIWFVFNTNSCPCPLNRESERQRTLVLVDIFFIILLVLFKQYQ